MEYLTKEEVEALVLRFVRGRGETGATVEEIRQVVNWGHEARLNAALLDLTLNGDGVGVDIQNGEMFFGIREEVQ